MEAPYTIDLHVHCREGNPEAQASAAETVDAASRAGLSGLCLALKLSPEQRRQQGGAASDGNAIVAEARRGHAAALQRAAALDGAPAIYFGIEYRIPKTVDDLLVLGLEPEALAGIDVIHADPWDFRRYVVERGGLLCASHPFRHRLHGAPFGGPNMVDAVEVLNGRRRFNNRDDLAARWCQRIERLALAGSDAHSVDEIGEATICLPSLPESNTALGKTLRELKRVDLRRRNFLWLGLQSCRFNGLYVEDELRHTSRQGLSAFEIYFDGFVPTEIDARARGRFASMAEGMGLRLSVVAPVVPLDGAAGADLVAETVAFAHDVRAPLVVLAALQLTDAAAVAPAVRAAAEAGITVAVSNGPDPDGRCGPADLRCAVEALEGAEIALDVGAAHLHSDAAAYTEELLGSLQRSGPRVVHLQLHDNDGRSDSHLNLGDGTLDLERVLRLLFEAGFDGTGIIEHWRDPRRDVERILSQVYAVTRPSAAIDVALLAAGRGAALL